MRIGWISGGLLIKANTKEEHKTLIKIYDFLENLEFGWEPETGEVGDSDDIELIGLDE